MPLSCAIMAMGWKVKGALPELLEGTLRGLFRFLCFAVVVAIFLFLGGAFSQGAGEPTKSERPPAIKVGASVGSNSSNSSSGSIMITMTGVMDDEASDQ